MLGRNRRASRGPAAAFTLVAAVALSDPAAPDSDELRKLLQRDVSAGSLALLAPNAREPAVAERIAVGLKSPRPDVRAVAARLANLGALQGLLPHVRAALGTESDPEAAVEEIRTLCALGGAAEDQAAIAAAARFAPRLDRELVRILARIRGPAAQALYFTSLHRLALWNSDREAFFRLSSRGDTALLTGAASRALGHRDPEAWRAILNVASGVEKPLEEAVFLAALAENETSFRGEAAWYLARAFSKEKPAQAQEMLAAVPRSTAVGAPTEPDPELRFGPEMLRRVLGEAPVEDEGWIACLETNSTCHLDGDWEGSPLVELLTPRERAAVLKRNAAGRPPEIEKGPAQKAPGGGPVESLGPRMVTGFPRGMVKDLLEISGCRAKAGKRDFALAEIDFRSDGLPRQVRLAAVPPFEACDRSADALFLMSLGPADDYVPPGRTIPYVAFFNPAAVECSEGSKLSPNRGGSPDVLRVRARVVAPKLVDKVQPVYPEAARQNREQGLSILEAVISDTGCVRDLTRIRSATPLLDLSAIEAVSRWRYKPATLDGKPINVYLTVTVTYKLN